MRRPTPWQGPGTPLFLAFFLLASAFEAGHAEAATCAGANGFSSCFDANSLWLPAGRATFFGLPDTRVTNVGQVSFGVATELLHRPVLLHADSPDPNGRDIHVVDYALDASFFLAFGVLKHLELSLAAPTRLYQTGAGAGGISSQAAPPVERNAGRNPRLGIAYSLDDTLATPGLGLRLGLDAALPLGDEGAFASEQSVVVMPTVTLAWRIARVSVSASVGARLRNAVEFGDVRLGNQGFAAFGVGVDLLDPGLLFLSLEGYGLPALSDSLASGASARLSTAALFPAEWFAGLHSSFTANNDWSLSLGAGSGLPLSSETSQSSSGPITSHFLGLTTPDFRSLLVLRYAPAARH